MSVLDFNVKVTIEAPALVDAVIRLSDRLTAPQTAAAPSVASPTQNVVESPTETATASTAVPAAPAAPAPVAPAPVAPAPAPTAAPVAPAPTTPSEPAPAKPIDLEAISRAGAALIDQGKLPQVMAVLKEFGVEAITQLQPATYPDFAGRLRALGADL